MRPVGSLVGPSGLEPPTSCLSGTRSNLLSYEPMWLVWIFSHLGAWDLLISGGDEGIRTLDPLLAGQVLSQLSYTPINRTSYLPRSKKSVFSHLSFRLSSTSKGIKVEILSNFSFLWIFSIVDFVLCRTKYADAHEITDSRPNLPVRFGFGLRVILHSI